MPPAPDHCDLCGLPLTSLTHTTTLSGDTYRFCCLGCRQVFTMLAAQVPGGDPADFRKTDLYWKCQDLGIIPRSRAEAPGRIAESGGPPASQVQKGKPESQDAHNLGENLLDLHLKVDGMWCPSCAWVIETALGNTDGVANAACDFSTDRLQCRYDPVATSPSLIVRAIGGLGYRATPAGTAAGTGNRRREMLRLTVSGGLTLNIMMLSFALYTGFYTDLSPDTVKRFSWPISIMATIVLLYGGGSIFQRAASGIRLGAHGMDTLVSLGVLSAFSYSVYSLFTGSLHLYFDTASMLITLVLLGKMLENHAKRDIQSDLDQFLAMQPTKARVSTPQFPDGRYVPIDRLHPKSIFIIEESEIIPADGRVEDGRGHVDESSLTGEARPLAKGPDDIIRGGTRLIEGHLRAEAREVGDESTLGQMTRIMTNALAEKTVLEGRTDRILRWFVPSIILLAAGTFLVCRNMDRPMDTSILRAITVMVMACPCALGIAIPLARVAGISLAGRNGVLVRNFSAFEQMAHVTSMVFDKTGTLTDGQWDLVDVKATGSFSDDRILSLARSLEQNIHHPIAAAIKKRAQGLPEYPVPLESILRFDNGLSATVGGAVVKIGSRGFLKAEVNSAGHLLDGIEPMDDPERSVVYMSHGGTICAVFIFGDRLKTDTLTAIRQLSEKRLRLSIVSGDRYGTTRAIGEKLGVSDASGDMLPGDKAERVAAMQQEGACVAMVGDGINDAPALAQADLAIAVHTGSSSNLSKEAADITLMRGELTQVLLFWHLAGAVNGKIRQNLTWAFLYNTIGLPIAMAGLLTPVIAVCAMLLSSLSVIANTLRLTRKTFTTDGS